MCYTPHSTFPNHHLTASNTPPRRAVCPTGRSVSRVSGTLTVRQAGCSAYPVNSISRDNRTLLNPQAGFLFSGVGSPSFPVQAAGATDGFDSRPPESEPSQFGHGYPPFPIQSPQTGRMPPTSCGGCKSHPVGLGLRRFCRYAVRGVADRMVMAGSRQPTRSQHRQSREMGYAQQ